MTNTHIHREAWLADFAKRLQPVFFAAGSPIPRNIRVACGFPSKRALAGKNTRIGECWSSSASYDGHFEVMVSPVIEDPMFVAGVLAHELVHAAVGLECGHKGPFKTLALAIGLTGKMTSTVPGDLFKRHADPILADVGPYPHAKLIATGRSSGPPKQNTRNLKCVCPDCGYTVRTTRIWLDMAGAPICPTDNLQMVEG